MGRSSTPLHAASPDRKARAPQISVRRPLMRAAVLALAALVAACGGGPPDNIQNACSIFAERRGWWDAVRDAEKRWGLEPHVTLAIIYRESQFEADARPARQGGFLFIPGRRPSSAYGYAQALDSTWDWYKDDTGRGGADRDDFRDAADFVAWYGAKSRELSGIALSDARNQYLAYHEGHGGYNRGSYRSKGWLVDRAGDVARRAASYERQLDTCRDDLDRRFLFFF